MTRSVILSIPEVKGGREKTKTETHTTPDNQLKYAAQKPGVRRRRQLLIRGARLCLPLSLKLSGRPLRDRGHGKLRVCGRVSCESIRDFF